MCWLTVAGAEAGAIFLTMDYWWLLLSPLAFMVCGSLAWAGSRWLLPRVHTPWHRKIAMATPQSRRLARAQRKREQKETTDWLRGLLGGYETLAYYVAFLLAGAGVLAFFLGWVGLKTALGWKRRGTETYYLQGAMLSLPLNLLNLAFGIAGGGLYKALQSLLIAPLC